MKRISLSAMIVGVVFAGSLCARLEADARFEGDATATNVTPSGNLAPLPAGDTNQSATLTPPASASAPAAPPIPAATPEPGTQVLPAVITPASLPPGATVKIQFNWQATGPLKHQDQVYVHFIGSSGVKFTNNHNPDVPTDSVGWNGKITYSRSIGLPATLAPDTYQVAVGFYPPKDKDPSDIQALSSGPGVSNLPWAHDFWVVGTVTVDPNAPLPKADTEGTKTLDLTNYKQVFSEDFDGPLSVSPWGPGTRWIAHTPWNGDFGDAKFTDPGTDFPFTIDKGVLRIEAQKGTGNWRAGLLASCDPDGKGFSQKYGYFECRAKMPPGPGVWPAFWLASQPPAPDAGVDVREGNTWDSWINRFDKAKESDIEIDVIEYYGHDPASYNSTVTVWCPAPHQSTMSTIYTKPNEVSDDFHNYGVMVEPDFITMYFDGVAVWKTKTPAEHTRPLMMLVNLALGSGWPIDKTPDPSYMYVKYIHAFAKNDAPKP